MSKNTDRLVDVDILLPAGLVKILNLGSCSLWGMVITKTDLKCAQMHVQERG